MDQSEPCIAQALRNIKQRRDDLIEEQLKREGCTYTEVALATKVSLHTVMRVAEKRGITRPVGYDRKMKGRRPPRVHWSYFIPKDKLVT
jgi:DNA invertase Pin-like site-specific DNA recombinase